MDFKANECENKKASSKKIAKSGTIESFRSASLSPGAGGNFGSFAGVKTIISAVGEIQLSR